MVDLEEEGSKAEGKKKKGLGNARMVQRASAVVVPLSEPHRQSL